LLSHHAPPLALLERFTFKDKSRKGRAIWAYEKGKEPRPTRSLTSEGSQHGYFSGSTDGSSEEELDAKLNLDFEVPFNRLLPIIDSDVHIFESAEAKRACALYVASLYHRSQARRSAVREQSQILQNSVRNFIEDDFQMRVFAAKLNVELAQPIYLDELKTSLGNLLVRSWRTISSGWGGKLYAREAMLLLQSQTRQ
jgi:hypothetical protein